MMVPRIGQPKIWDWIANTTSKQICDEICRAPNLFFEALAADCNNRTNLTYSLVSKVFSLFPYYSLNPEFLNRINAALESAGLFQRLTINDSIAAPQIADYIRLGQIDKALEVFRGLKLTFGYEEFCAKTFDWALIHGRPQFVLQALEDFGEKKQAILNKCLYEAAIQGKLDLMEFYLANGADLHMKQLLYPSQAAQLGIADSECTLMHIACLQSNIPLLHYLIQKKFNIALLKDFCPIPALINRNHYSTIAQWLNTYGELLPEGKMLTPQIQTHLLELAYDSLESTRTVQPHLDIVKALWKMGLTLESSSPRIDDASLILLHQAVEERKNPHRVLFLFHLFDAIKKERSEEPDAMERFADFFIRYNENSLEEIIKNLLAPQETRQAIFNLLASLADNAALFYLLKVLVSKEFYSEQLLLEAVATLKFKNDTIIYLLKLCVTMAYRDFTGKLASLCLTSIMRRLSPLEKVYVIEISLLKHKSLFETLLAIELPYCTDKENNLLDVVLQEECPAEWIKTLLNEGFMVENLPQKLLKKGIQEENEELLELAALIGANFSTTLINGIDPVSYAIIENKISALRLMIAKGRNPDEALFRPPFPVEENSKRPYRPINLALKEGRYLCAQVIAEKSSFLRNLWLRFRWILTTTLGHHDADEKDRKAFLSTVLKGFPLVCEILNNGSLSDFRERFQGAVEILVQEENFLKKLETSPEQSIFEIIWLLDDWASGLTIIKNLTTYETVLSLNCFLRKLGEDSQSYVLSSLLGVSTNHYEKGRAAPLIPPFQPIDLALVLERFWEMHSTLSRNKELTEPQVQHIMRGLKMLHDLGKSGKIISGLAPEYPKQCQEAFLAQFNLNEQLSLLADLMLITPRKDLIPEILMELTNPLLMSCFLIHKHIVLLLHTLLIDIFSKCTFAPDMLLDDDNPTLPQNISGGINWILNHIKDRKGHLGTPPQDTPELEVFYARLKLSLVHLVKLLHENNDEHEKQLAMIELGIAGNHCAGRWMGAVLQQLMIARKDVAPITFDEIIYQELRYLRQTILESLLSNGEHNVHMYNQMFRAVGKFLGLPGEELLEGVQDIFANPQLSRHRILAAFYEHYVVLAIVKKIGALLDELFKKVETREMISQWIRQNLPKEMSKDVYWPMIRAVESAIEKGAEREEIKALMPGVQWNEEEKNPLKAIEEARLIQFMNECVLDCDTGGFQTGFVIYLLIKLQVLVKPLL